MSMPPTKPTLPVFEAIAASMPTRNEPSCSLKTTEWTFGLSTTASMIAKLQCSGTRRRPSRAPPAWQKPTATIGDMPVAGEAAQRLLALGLVLGLELAVLDAGVLLELLGAVIGRPR